MDECDILAELHEALESANRCDDCVSSCCDFLVESRDTGESFFGPADCEELVKTCARTQEALGSIIPALKSSVKLIIDHATDTPKGLETIVTALCKATE